MADTTTYPDLTEISQTVLDKRYLLRDPNTEEIIETPDQMFRRVAIHVASAEATPELRAEWTEKFYNIMRSLRFMPNSPTLMNAGTGKGTLSACFVIPINDSLEDILEGSKAAGMVQKFGGGTGYSLSRLRMQGDYLSSTQGSACGPISVLDHLNDVSRLVTQGGKREGANMGVMRYNHPDIMQFVTKKHNISRCIACKERGDEHWGKDHDFVEDKGLVNFNVSVAVDSEFFRAVREDDYIPLVNYRRLDHAITESDAGTVVGSIRAKELFNAILENAHHNGDPGLLFMERINNWRSNPVQLEQRGTTWTIDATNPCGEKPLFDWDSCNLGHLDVSKYVVDADPTGTGPQEPWFAYGAFIADIEVQTRFLDNVITVNYWPLNEIEHVALLLRRIGNGVMGVADMLFRMGIPYDSEEALELCERVAAQFEETSFEASVKLAEERGAFPMWEQSIYNHISGAVDTDVIPAHWLGRKVRNSIRTTIAPTGTTAMIAGCTGSIEPAPGLAFVRQHKIEKNILTGEHDWVQMYELNPWFNRELKRHIASSDIRDEITKRLTNQESLADIDDDMSLGLPEEFIRVFVTSKDIAPEWHIRHQATWQHHIDDGVSKTINMPENATVEDFEKAYLMANELGCLGITCYRDNSRSYQVLNVRPSDLQAHPTYQPVASPKTGVPDAPPLVIPPLAKLVHEPADPQSLTTITPPTAVVNYTTINAGGPSRHHLPDERPALVHKFTVGGQEGYLTVGFGDDGKPKEFFIKIAKQGSTVHGFADALAIVLSVSLQYGVPLDALLDKLRGLQFEPFGFTRNERIPEAKSIADYLARYLETVQIPYTQIAVVEANEFSDPEAEGVPVTQPGDLQRLIDNGKATMVEAGDSPVRVSHGATCPDCGSLTYHNSGCEDCYSCGWSKCG